MFRSKIRLLFAATVLVAVHSASASADPTIVSFAALIGFSNDIDTADVFNEGYGADLAGQIITGSVTIDPGPLGALCASGGACYADFGAGAISVSFTLNGVTTAENSIGTLGYFGNRSGGSVDINSLADGGDNYLAAGATSADGMIQQSIGVLFNNATAFSASSNAAAAIASLTAIGGGTGLVVGGITYMNPVEHLDATIIGVDVPEPAGFGVFGMALLAVMMVRRTRIG